MSLWTHKARKRWLGAAMILAAGFVLPNISPAAVATGYDGPTLEAVYASPEASPLDDWKIYLKGSDPTGDIKFINVWVFPPGAPSTPSRLRVDRDQGHSISGYLVLNSVQFGYNARLFGPPFRVRVMLEDKNGNDSQEAWVKVSFYQGAKQTHPAGSLYGQRFLGQIPVDFYNPNSLDF